MPHSHHASADAHASAYVSAACLKDDRVPLDKIVVEPDYTIENLAAVLSDTLTRCAPHYESPNVRVCLSIRMTQGRMDVHEP